MDFKKKVYEAVKRIPKGKVVSYQMVAAVIGQPTAARAVGNALNQNIDFKNIPCHRVIKSDGNVGGYVKGMQNKIIKLSAEGIVIKRGRIDWSAYRFDW